MRAALLLLLAASAEAQTLTVDAVNISGLERLENAAVIAHLKMAAGARVSRADLDASCQKLIETGLFESCEYNHSSPKPATARLELKVREAPAPNKARLTVPGVDEAKLWAWLKSNAPLVKPDIPGSDDAINFYTAAIQRYLAASGGDPSIVAAIETDLATKQLTFIFRPKNLPLIADVTFEGASALTAAQLRSTLLPVAKGTPFTEFDVRNLLSLNILPLYENLGRLNASFPSVAHESTPAGAAVRITVNEGAVYKLAGVTFGGDAKDRSVERAGFPIGQIAAWDQIVKAADALRDEYKNSGHLGATYEIARTPKPDSTVDISATYQIGPVFTFGELILAGLPASLEARVRPLWKLKPGAPVSDSYTSEFTKAAFTQLGAEFTGVVSAVSVRPGTHVADVKITFRRAGDR